MLVDSALVVGTIVTGNERLLFLGQGVVGVAWTAALLGLLGLYPSIANRRRWLSRVGAVFAIAGVVSFAVMALSVAFYATGIPSGEYDAISMLFIPGVLVGSVLGFVVFGAASLRSDGHPRELGVLLFVPALLVLGNILRFIAGNTSVTVTFAIVVGDALAMLALGYVLRTRSPATVGGTPAESAV